MNDQRARRSLEPGISILVGTVDPSGTPSCCRAIAIASTDSLASVTIYLPIATSQAIIQDVATTHRVAIAASHPIEQSSVQLKGRAQTARIARDDERAFVRDRFEAWAETLDRIGVPRRVTRSVAHWPAFAIEMQVEAIFDQTPGPNAGARLR